MLEFCCSINIGNQVFDEIFTKNSQDKKLLIAFFGAIYKKETVLEHLLREDCSVFIEILCLKLDLYARLSLANSDKFLPLKNIFSFNLT